MAYTLEVKHPEFPDGFEFDCDGILVENGKSRKLTAEDELAFISRVGRTVKEIYGHGTFAKLSGTTEIDSKAEKDQAKALIEAQEGGK